MIRPVEYEPYDPKTPRLSYDQVAVAVMKLPTEALAILMRGPIEVSGTCNVCRALETLVEAEDVNATLLQEWHDDLGFSEHYADTLKKRVINPDALDAMIEEGTQVLGSIQYARCCVIYALARVEFNDRERRG